MAEKVQLEIEVSGIKTVGEASEKVESLKTQLKKLKEQLASGTLDKDQFNKMSAEAGELNDRLIETNNIVKNLSQSKWEQGLAGFVDVAQGIAGGFAAAQGAIAIFGSENEDLEKTLLKVQGAVALLNGVQSVSNVLQKDSAALNLLNTTRLNILTAVQARYTAVVGTTTGALKALRIVGATLGIGLIVTAIALLISKFNDIKKSVERFIPSMEKIGNLFRNVWNAITDFVGVTSDATRALDRFNESQDRLIRKQEEQLDLLKAQGASRQQIYEKELEILRNRNAKYAESYRVNGELSRKELDETRENLHAIEVLEAEHSKYLADEEEKRNKEAADKRQKKRDQAKKDEELARNEAIKREEERIKALNDLNAQRDAIEQESLLRNLSNQDREVAEIRLKYQEKFLLFQNDADTKKLLQEQLNADILAINTKYDDLELQRQQKAAADAEKLRLENLAREKAISDAKKSILNDYTNAAIDLGGLLIQDEQKRLNFQKAAALVKIGIDTAQAIASAVKESEENEANSETYGLAGAAQLAGSIARIAANIGQAYQVLNGGKVGSSSSSGGQGFQSTPSITGFNTGSGNNNQTGGGRQPVRIYVTETDIRSAGNKVDGIYSQATVE